MADSDNPPGSFETETAAAMQSCCRSRLASRIYARDEALWPGDAHRWLDWLDAPDASSATLARLDAIAAAARAHEDVLLLGMGGSSLCPEVLAESFGRQPGFPRLRILDSSVPGDVLQREATLDPARTLLIVASKSGTTLETDVARRYFSARMPAASDGRLPIIAITDPGTALAQLADDEGYRHLALGKPGIGGRFSALSIFGLLPAATMGLDVSRLLTAARAMAERCRRDEADNPGLALGVALATAAARGRDKLTLVASQPVATLGAWVEQLVAESTGKGGKGIVPIDLEPLGTPDRYGDDRIFVHTRVAGDTDHDTALAALRRAGHPVIVLDIDGPYDLGGEFFRWQFATAVAGHLMALNPFDQPDVEAAKQAARRSMEPSAAGQAAQRSVGRIDDVEVWLPSATSQTDPVQALREAVTHVPTGGYVAIQAYVLRDATTAASLSAMRDLLRSASGCATTYGFGPRFLHSTGQLHKGGPAEVLCLQITCDDPTAVAIPGRDFDFGALKQAQAEGDFEVLAARGRPILRLHVGADDAASLNSLLTTLGKALT